MAKKYYSHQQIRKSIKRDELRDFTNRAFHFARTNTENLLISAVIVAVVAILVPLYFNHLESNEHRASSLLNNAINYYIQPLAGQHAAVGSEAFRSLDEKYKKTQQAYSEVATTYKNTKSAQIARLGEANALFFQKKYNDALAIYQQELPQHVKDTLGSSIQFRMGQCQESQAHWKEALGIYQEILRQDSQNYNRHAIRQAMARCYSGLGQKAEAEKLLNEEKAEKGGGYWAEAARQQLAMGQENQKSKLAEE
jgi:predicted negative regulator of RcsB-dependent stress response